MWSQKANFLKEMDIFWNDSLGVGLLAAKVKEACCLT